MPETKEQAYDEHIAPLMDRIIAACKEHGIACFATFDISAEDNPDFFCTTALPDGHGKQHQAIKDCCEIMTREPIFTAFTITKGD